MILYDSASPCNLKIPAGERAREQRPHPDQQENCGKGFTRDITWKRV